uniref:Hexosyltransferase n=1 Tax=Alexandrium catenella TaxID=2925 RepID=A0A7S1QBZ4_ALECA|mmetsp:Transcript_26940/g.73097  ORF Transcript_26940/g.73097 Transcript_26940/m.73097 type:complete len:335 (+) Transcript_26940:46-1050(+)
MACFGCPQLLAVVVVASAAALGHCLSCRSSRDGMTLPQPTGNPKIEREQKSRSRMRSLPPIERFRHDWGAMNTRQTDYIQERDLKVGGVRIQLVVGVFSMAGSEEKPYRDVMRQTWMMQPSVCSLASGQSGHCSVYVTFVVGNDGEQDETEEGVTILPIKENMDEGKTRVWFGHAASAWPWGTHVVKLDADAFPYLSYVLGTIARMTSGLPCKNVYGGDIMTWSGPVYLPPRGCGLPIGSDFTKYHLPDPNCFAYAQGAMYFMTRELALNASKAGEYWDLDTKAHCYPEDVTTGRGVKHYADDHGVCVSTVHWDPRQARWHQRAPVRPWRGCPK